MDSRSGQDSLESKTDPDIKPKEHHAPASDDTGKTPKKRRKVNHACVYCRRSHMTCDLERPCMRCIKRNIGHLCHDEPRETDSKKTKGSVVESLTDDLEPLSERGLGHLDQTTNVIRPRSFDSTLSPGVASGVKTFDSPMGRTSQSQAVQASTSSGGPDLQSALSSDLNQFSGFSDAWLTAQTHFHDVHNYHPSYMIVPEVSNEFNLLNEFLQSSLLDDGLLPDSATHPTDPRQDIAPSLLSAPSGNIASLVNPQGPLLPSSAEQSRASGNALPVDKAREYYLQAADPSGNDAPEERMQRILKAKYDAGLLKPFNYVKGYARLSSYLDTHVAATSKQKIIRQIDRFRPKFREKMHALSDMDLIIVEMWFEKTLIDYDRVFASMAVPACCWRRTGEIFRGNQEMAELINVPVERLRDGKISLHEILTEESVVRYWEEFGTIAFDAAHDTLLTACSLKNPDDKSNDPIVNCCFSFMIRKDDHKVPTLIVGNFLPHDPPSV